MVHHIYLLARERLKNVDLVLTISIRALMDVRKVVTGLIYLRNIGEKFIFHIFLIFAIITYNYLLTRTYFKVFFRHSVGFKHKAMPFQKVIRVLSQVILVAQLII